MYIYVHVCSDFIHEHKRQFQSYAPSAGEQITPCPATATPQQVAFLPSAPQIIPRSAPSIGVRSGGVQSSPRRPRTLSEQHTALPLSSDGGQTLEAIAPTERAKRENVFILNGDCDFFWCGVEQELWAFSTASTVHDASTDHNPCIIYAAPPVFSKVIVFFVRESASVQGRAFVVQMDRADGWCLMRFQPPCDDRAAAPDLSSETTLTDGSRWEKQKKADVQDHSPISFNIDVQWIVVLLSTRGR